MHRHAAHQLGDRLVADKAGFGDDDLIPRLDKGANGKVDRLAAADRDQHVLGFIAQLKAAGKVVADLGAQLLQPGVGGVLGTPLLQAADAGIADAPRGLEIRLADAQRDAVGHIGSQIEELANARRTHLLGSR